MAELGSAGRVRRRVWVWKSCFVLLVSQRRLQKHVQRVARTLKSWLMCSGAEAVGTAIAEAWRRHSHEEVTLVALLLARTDAMGAE